MNGNISALHAIAARPRRDIVGLMSGTSMDGLDVALCSIEGAGSSTAVAVRQFATVAYADTVKDRIREVFAQETVDLCRLTLLNAWVGELHADMVLDCLRGWGVAPDAVDLIASHGQTVMHAPAFLHRQPGFGDATLQIGDGDRIAVRTGIITLSDFRQKHIAAGGQGAPLAVYGDRLIFRDAREDRIMLNIGGIANFTYLPAAGDAAELLVTDTGPGNTMLDALTRRHFPTLAYDRDAAIASGGTVDRGLLAALKDDPFFRAPAPKTTGPELFNLDYLAARGGGVDLAPADAMATLTRFSAETIAEAVAACVAERGGDLADFHVYASGGGVHNPLLMRWLRDLLPCPIGLTDDLGVSADAKEAVLFAILANEAVAGTGGSAGTVEVGSVSLGKVSFPN